MFGPPAADDDYYYDQEEEHGKKHEEKRPHAEPVALHAFTGRLNVGDLGHRSSLLRLDRGSVYVNCHASVMEEVFGGQRSYTA
jgi:hypothetical protein